MAGILQRLVDLGRAHLNDFLAPRWPGASSTSTWETDFANQEQTHSTGFGSSPPVEAPAPAGHGLPYSVELARCYQRLDLPFGAPMERVTRQWRAYLKQVHPDRHANDPAKQADATILSQQLNDAYTKIKLAWKRHQR